MPPFTETERNCRGWSGRATDHSCGRAASIDCVGGKLDGGALGLGEAALALPGGCLRRFQ